MLAHGSGFDALIPPQTVAHVTDHSALILTPENSTTLSHFSTSLAMNLPKSPGEPGSGVPPTSAIRALRPRIDKSGVELLVELLHDLGRRAAWRANAVPGARLITWQEITHRRNLREEFRTCRRCDRQRSHLATAYQLDRARQIVEGYVHHTRNEIRKPARSDAAVRHMQHADLRFISPSRARPSRCRPSSTICNNRRAPAEQPAEFARHAPR
jgi:hypothetical protein